MKQLCTIAHYAHFPPPNLTRLYRRVKLGGGNWASVSYTLLVLYSMSVVDHANIKEHSLQQTCCNILYLFRNAWRGELLPYGLS